MNALTTVSPTHCVECGRRVKPGDWTCGRCSEPRMRPRGPRVKRAYGKSEGPGKSER